LPLLLPFKRAGNRERVFQLALYPGIVALAALILFPFALMFSLSFGDPSDWWRHRKWPDLSYLFSAKRMYVYYLALKYDYWAGWTGFNRAYGTSIPDEVTIRDGMTEPPRLDGNWRARADDGIACLKEKVPWTHATVMFTGWGYFSEGVPVTAYTGLGDESWKKHLKRKYGTIEAVNTKFQTEFLTFAHVQVPELPAANRREAPPLENAWLTEYRDFLENSVKPHWRLARSGGSYYRAYLESLEEVRTGIDTDPAATATQRSAARLARINRLCGMSCTTWNEFHLPEAVPVAARQRTYWERYVREIANPHFLRLATDDRLGGVFAKFLVARHGSEENVRSLYGVASGDVPLPARVHEAVSSATAYYDWDAFVREAPIEAVRVYTNETIWREFLAAKYPTIAAINTAYGTAHAGFADVPWPQPEIDRLDWESHRRAYVAEMILKNYRRAWTLITVSSPALLNTLKFALLFTVLSVIVNGAAGYALSRFALGPGQIVLVAFLALGAFPIEAMAVPNFLLLRKLGLLNTIWALVLPTVVNGYFIYLMKSVFDTIPRNYFEQAQVEGADDFSIFWRIAIPMARPMLAVVGLYAFLWSYSNFIWALIVCQQQSQWTLPVFIFNVNSYHAPAPLLGALMVLASLPPLLVFVFAHRTLQHSLTLPRA